MAMEFLFLNLFSVAIFRNCHDKKIGLKKKSFRQSYAVEADLSLSKIDSILKTKGSFKT